ncbi:diguanylate cyclase [Roseibacterium sp. SDUM158017]|uniref:diguanylate cyclase domain-containing protein n=1 Tax=Roseicyclus salinarum TaxID=3036773 RepID=UPI002414DD54|nr:diguanylate cyclase [Roseibacterium sp. SDUM158017]MDG4647990.1 diguanylate cyclase [Roseibacterium sp. SDUM158017]
MNLYHFMSRVFPRSFRAKVACIAFLGVHVPLLGFIGYLVAISGFSGRYDLIAVVLGATLLGTVVTIFALGVILAPLREIEATMAAVVDRRHIEQLPEDYKDELGSLMRSVNSLIRGMERQIELAAASAEIDHLTGLLNRRGFERLVPDPAFGAILFFDLDRFKMLNDALGHAAGDDALRAFARIASSLARSDDVLARLGGEEFALYLPGVSEDVALAVAERIRAEVANQLIVENRRVTVSVGVAHAPITAVPRETLMEAADMAMYAAKQGGRNRVARVADSHTAVVAA